jgi:hypothetical protein
MLEELVTIKLDKVRHLRLSLKGMLEFEKLTGKTLLKGFKFKDLTLSDMAALIWACLIHEDKELTYDDVLDMIDTSNMEAASEAVVACVIQSFPEPKEQKAHPLAETPPSG